MEYLLTNRKLDLPGIGTFRMIEEGYETSEDIKHKHPAINFENNPSLKEASELISFLSSKTGKMKALVAADLDSYLMLAQEFLNIGKPFQFEGIGSLSKMQSGGYAFIPEKQNDHSSKEISKTSSTEESFTDYEKVFSPPKEKSNWKKPAAIVLILAGFGIAIWLGYLAYKNRTPDISMANEVNQSGITLSDSTIKTDSLITDSNASTNEGYKFVIEVASESRAFERFDKLKSYGWDIKMETKDSLRYKLYLLLQLPLADTSKVLDSLTTLNGRRVYIEK
jgi:hypothetical protein